MARFLNSIATRMWVLAGVMAAVTLFVIVTAYYSAISLGVIERTGMPSDVRNELRHLAETTRSPRYIRLSQKYDGGFRADDWAFILAVCAISTAAGGTIGLVLARRISRPITAVAAAASRVAAGDRTVRVDGSRASGETRELVDSFNVMAKDIEAYERERSVLTAGIAHELRTPLTILRGRLHGLIDGVIVAGPDEASRLLRQVDQLSRLVEDLRTLAHVEAGELSLDLQRLDPADTVRTVVIDLQPRADTAGLRVSLVLEAASIFADPMRLYQIVANLLTNAIKHSPSGGEITVSIVKEDRDMLLTVEDEGPGFSEDDRAKLFLPFWRAAASRDAGHGGSGLGLTLANRMAEAHGGSVTAANRADGPGARFTVRLPLALQIAEGGVWRIRGRSPFKSRSH